MSYAQARLRLGVAAVGWWVLLCLLLLRSRLAECITLNEMAATYLLCSAFFDVLGGQLLPWRWRKARVGWGRWLALYVRGLLLHTGLWFLGVLSTCLIYQKLGLLAGPCWFVLATLGLARSQLLLLRAMGVKVEGRVWGWEVRACDQRFSGGLLGPPVPGREATVLPSHWLASEAPSGLEQAIGRRRALSVSGARAAGWWLGVLFDAWVLARALQWSGGQPAVMVCWATLLSLVGLLVLPGLSRPGVLAADRLAPCPEEWLSWLERQQEEDPVRNRWVERIFHPLPQWSVRRAHLKSGRPPKIWPWNPARYALICSLLCGSLLSRAVHCNCGRPELWFWPPND
ncbi:MAG: hypothetical protein U0931_37875 [Vulcanimicrobiota bacterium]